MSNHFAEYLLDHKSYFFITLQLISYLNVTDCDSVDQPLDLAGGQDFLTGQSH